MSPGSQAALIPRLLQAEPPDTYLPIISKQTLEFNKHSLTFERMTFKSQARLNLSDLSTENGAPNLDESQHHHYKLTRPCGPFLTTVTPSSQLTASPLTRCCSTDAVLRCLSRCLRSLGHFLSSSLRICISSL